MHNKHSSQPSLSYKNPLSPEDLDAINAYWRAANYLSVGQIYLLDNPLLHEPIQLAHVKPRLLGHWGTTPGLNFLYVHCNRVIKKYNLNMLFMTGPGHGGPALVANTYLEGSYTEFYPEITEDTEGMQRLFKQFSFPGGIPSHVAPETPGSIHEGGELGYVIAHSYGAVFDNPNLIVCSVIGDGEAETGPLAASWHSNKFLNPVEDGAVLPILHLNGYKIANPSLLARIPKEELTALLDGYGYTPFYVEGEDPTFMHQEMARTFDHVIEEIHKLQHDARVHGFKERTKWPMIVLKSPKGWTGPKTVDGKQTEGSWRSHQVPFSEMSSKPAHVRLLEQWMKSYKPEELFDEKGRLLPRLQALAPKGDQRMGCNPHANGGLLLRKLHMPNFRDHALDIPAPGKIVAESAKVMGKFLRDVMQRNLASKNFRVFGPDETASNKLGALYEITDKVFTGEIFTTDEHLAHEGKVMEILSEHVCQGWLEGYLLTGRHGFFSCYEAFIHIIDSMFNQHAKWLKTTREIPWRLPIASLNYFLTSHVWRQDHNGFSHQDPGFIDHVINKKGEIIRVYLPPDANTLLCVTDHCLKSKNLINVIIAGKQPALQYLTIDQAVKHCKKGIGIWKWASNDYGHEPDVIFACAGDVPTLETLAAVAWMRAEYPDVYVRVINIVDLMTLQPPKEHPHGLSDVEFNDLFTTDKPVIFAFHGYPWLIHRMTYRRANHENIHVRGYKEEGTTTTPFDMVVLNELDRFHLIMEAAERVPKMLHNRAYLRDFIDGKLIQHQAYIRQYGDDMPEIRDWKWPY